MQVSPKSTFTLKIFIAAIAIAVIFGLLGWLLGARESSSVETPLAAVDQLEIALADNNRDAVEDILDTREDSADQTNEKADRMQEKYGSGDFTFTSISFEDTPSEVFFGVSATATTKNDSVKMTFFVVRLENGEWRIKI